MKDLKDKAAGKEQARKSKAEVRKERVAQERNNAEKIAGKLGITQEIVEHCCGSVCPDCVQFLDIAITREELGLKSHLTLNPTQQEAFAKALEIYRRDKDEYKRVKGELIKSIRPEHPPVGI